ncbi:MAG: hypothetical protein CM1200mP20_09430 [Pseudomonadota bacterium]|nr:MAG: hypothetical protein CM1200mP20_09430 [Pseudomonadota bacterium]
MTTGGKERFTALDATEPVTVPAGEVAYTSGPDFPDRHFMWPQITARTGHASQHPDFLVSEIGGAAGEPGGGKAMRGSMTAGGFAIYSAFPARAL